MSIKPQMYQIQNLVEAIGTIDHDNACRSASSDLVQTLIGGVSVPITMYNPSGLAQTLNPAVAKCAWVVLSDNCTISLDQYVVQGMRQSISLIIETGAWLPTLGFTVNWSGGVAPTFAINTTYSINLWSVDNWATVYGELMHETTQSSTIQPSVTAAYHMGDTFTQFNIATETAMDILVIPITSGSPGGAYSAINVVNRSFAILRFVAIYAYPTNTYKRAAVRSRTAYDYKQVNMAVDYVNDYSRSLSIVGTSFIKIDTYTLASTIAIANYFLHDYYAGVNLSISWYALLLGKGSSGTGQTNATQVHWSSDAVTVTVLPYAVYKPAAWANDTLGSGSGYIFAGTDIFKRTAVNVYSTLGAVLPTLIQNPEGMASDGIKIWGYRATGPFTFTIATEAVAVGLTRTLTQFRGVVHGDTMTS